MAIRAAPIWPPRRIGNALRAHRKTSLPCGRGGVANVDLAGDPAIDTPILSNGARAAPACCLQIHEQQQVASGHHSYHVSASGQLRS